MNKPVFPSEILAQHVAVLGKTGSGKTSTAKFLIEQVVHDGARVCVLDPIKSDWWGLTSSADGKRAGLPFHILGGPRGHVPLHASAGKAIGEIVANGQLPLSIIDMADFEPGGQSKFFVDFAPTLLRKMRGVVYLVIEEAHVFAPKERSGIGAENMSIHWAKTLATAGRSKGVRLVLVTQRTQALHNALLGSCDTMIVHRLTAPADQEPVIKWLKSNVQDAEIREQVTNEMSSLKTGTGWLCSGEAKVFELVHFPRIATYDNTATPTGDGDVREIKTATVDQEKLRTIIGDAVKEAQANDPRELRKENARLQQELAKAQQVKPPTPASIKTVEKLVLTDADRALLDKLSSRLDVISASLAMRPGTIFTDLEERLRAVISNAVTKVDEESVQLRATFLKTVESKGFQNILGKLATVQAPTPITHHNGSAAGSRTSPAASQGRRVAPVAATSRPTSLVSPSSAEGDGKRVKGCAAAILSVLAQYPDGCLKGKLALLAGYPYNGSFRTRLSELRTAGLIVGGNEEVMRITDAGLAQGPFPSLPEAGAERAAYWLAQFKGQAQTILAALLQHEAGLTSDELATATGYPWNGSFRTRLSELRTAGVIVGKNTDVMRASEELLS